MIVATRATVVARARADINVLDGTWRGDFLGPLLGYAAKMSNDDRVARRSFLRGGSGLALAPPSRPSIGPQAMMPRDRPLRRAAPS